MNTKVMAFMKPAVHTIPNVSIYGEGYPINAIQHLLLSYSTFDTRHPFSFAF